MICSDSGIERAIVGHKGAPPDGVLDHRMAPLANRQSRRCHRRAAGQSAATPRLRPSATNTSKIASALLIAFERGIMQPPTCSRTRASKVSLQFLHEAFGVEHLGFVFFELRRDIALAIGQGLLAQIIAPARTSNATVGHLDVVAEHPVVAHLQRMNAGAPPLAGFESARSNLWRGCACRESRRARHRIRRE